MTNTPRCLRCGKPLSDHQRITSETIAASQGATYEHPRNGFLSPLSPSTVGQWLHHDPMPWSDAAAEEAYYADHR